MISFKEAYDLVINQPGEFGNEVVDIKEATARVLNEEIKADREFPPFNRSTKDGIAIKYSAINEGLTNFKIQGMLPAGLPSIPLENNANCIEIMTGAVVPSDADTVVMYEDIQLKDGRAYLHKVPKMGANIHSSGSDLEKGAIIVDKHSVITPAISGALASVGKGRVSVKRLPRVSVISTGKELVEIDEVPLPYQIRRSNVYTLHAALSQDNIQPLLLHLDDDKDIIRQKLQYAIQEMDVLLLSGGVSKGKFDFIPEILEELGTQKFFHRVRQRPGKPFWFGKHKGYGTTIFSFPGNPVSTYANYCVYFRPWLRTSLSLPDVAVTACLSEAIENANDLTAFIGVETSLISGKLVANSIKGNGSGDLISLTAITGFIRLDPKRKYKKGAVVPFISINN